MAHNAISKIATAEDETTEQLSDKLAEMRQRIARLEALQTERRRAKRVVQEAREYAENIVATVRESLVILSTDLKVISANRSFYQVFQVTPEETEGWLIYDLGNRQWDIPRLRELLEKVLPQNTAFDDFEVEHNFPTIGQKVMLVNARKVYRETSEVEMILFAIEDITERRKAEQELRESEEKYRTLIESSLTGSAIHQDGRHIFVNDRFAAIHGYTVQELMGKEYLALIHPDERETAKKRVSRRLEGQALPETYESRRIRKDGSVIWTRIVAALIQYRGKPAVLANVIDSTRNKEAEEALRQSEEKLRIMFESLPQGIIVTDLEGDITQVNEAVVCTHGYDSRQELIGQSTFELIAEKDHDRAVGNLIETLENGHRGVIEYTFLRKDGSEFPAELNGAMLSDADGNAIGLIAITEDITERRKMEEQLVVTDRLASIGELASGIAHELNNPLTGIIGFSELLLERGVPDDIRDDLKIINREARRTAEIVRNLLTFARKHAPGREEVHINQVVENVLSLRSYEQKINNIQVNTGLASDLPEIMADCFQLQQVFLNIIINAEHFMTEAHGRGTLTITTERVGDVIRVSFADDGPGISRGNLGHLFDPFFTTKEVGKGTGLGLSICHGIVAEHGGKIYAESELGRGPLLSWSCL
ncbi:PAS domain S-box protein [Chloroflexota bacterium]